MHTQNMSQNTLYNENNRVEKNKCHSEYPIFLIPAILMSLQFQKYSDRDFGCPRSQPTFLEYFNVASTQHNLHTKCQVELSCVWMVVHSTINLYVTMYYNTFTVLGSICVWHKEIYMQTSPSLAVNASLYCSSLSAHAFTHTHMQEESHSIDSIVRTRDHVHYIRWAKMYLSKRAQMALPIHTKIVNAKRLFHILQK